MKLVMIENISGHRTFDDDDERQTAEWPAAGETIDLPDDEANDLIASGLAEKAGKKAKAETADAVEPDAETPETPAE
jgi:hypothetical protein